MILIAKNKEELNQMINQLYKRSLEEGLEMKHEKTKILSKNSDMEIKIGKWKVGNGDEIIYLGQLISLENNTQKEVERRIAIN